MKHLGHVTLGFFSVEAMQQPSGKYYFVLDESVSGMKETEVKERAERIASLLEIRDVELVTRDAKGDFVPYTSKQEV